MAIQPLSDIVLDVAMAADPVRAEAAKQKLLQAGGSLGDSFGEVLSAQAGPAGPGGRWSAVSEARFFASATGPAVTHGGTAEEAKRGLETMIAKMMVETMLPKDGGAFFGKGNAGGVWKSMLADKLAAELTKGNGLGILRNTTLGKG